MMAVRPVLRVVRSPAAQVNDDATLVARMRRGDSSAEEALYRAYAPFILGLVTRLLGQRSEAEDATQDTFILAFEKIHDLRQPAALRPWLTQIAVSQARRRFRRGRLLRALGLHVGADDATLDSLVSPGVPADTRTDLAALDRILRALPTEQRMAWMLRYVEGEELEAVAHACACSLATVKRRIAAADAHVRLEVRVGEAQTP